MMNTFLSKDNITIIWDVISDEDIFKFLSKDIQNDIYKVFLENLSMFYDTERKKTNNLIEANKKYIMLLLNHIKTKYHQKIPSKIKIINEPPPTKSLVTYEEIHNDRKTQFEEDLTKLEEEFTSAMTLQVPDVPDFTDKYTDEPISEIDKLLKEMTSKRNYDIEQISQNHSSQKDTNNWLKPQETSIKSDKFLSSKENEKEKEQKKNVTWDTENNFEIKNENIVFEESEIENNIEQNIFKKLKKVEPTNNENSLKIQIMMLNNKMDMILDFLREK